MVLWVILETDKQGTQTNGREDKQIAHRQMTEIDHMNQEKKEEDYSLAVRTT